MLLSRQQNAGQNHDIKITNRSFENLAHFIYLGMTVRNQNFIQEELMGRLDLVMFRCHSVQNFSSSRLLSRNIRIRIYKAKFLPVVLCMGVKLGL
jgi:hypothetical protein